MTEIGDRTVSVFERRVDYFLHIQCKHDRNRSISSTMRREAEVQVALRCKLGAELLVVPAGEVVTRYFDKFRVRASLGGRRGG